MPERIPMQWRHGVIARWSVAVVAAAALVAPAAAQFGGKPTRPQVEPPKGPVRQVIFKNCTSCHGIDDYAYNALDRAGWNALIDSKHKDLNVRIQDKDRDLLLDWAVARFGPDSKPFPRAYIPPEITTFFSDPEAQTLLDRACTTCHGEGLNGLANVPKIAGLHPTASNSEDGVALAIEQFILNKSEETTWQIERQ